VLDIALWPWLSIQASYGHDPHKHELKFKGQLVQKIELKQTEGQTDATDCFTLPANVVGNYLKRFVIENVGNK